MNEFKDVFPRGEENTAYSKLFKYAFSRTGSDWKCYI